MEDKGVWFTKDEKGWRMYSEENIQFFEYLCNMKTRGKSLEEATNHIAMLYHAHLAIAPPAIALQTDHSLTNFMQAQHEFNQKLLERFERMEQRQLERDQQLMKAIRETQAVKTQLVATHQKKWWKFWG